jgi:hypothetical protein
MQLERVQKAALAIIFDQRYRNYAHALKLSGLKSLAERRKPVKARTHRFANSPIAYLTQLLNEDRE